jgi:hypothetical protein
MRRTRPSTIHTKRVDLRSMGWDRPSANANRIAASRRS